MVMGSLSMFFMSFFAKLLKSSTAVSPFQVTLTRSFFLAMGTFTRSMYTKTDYADIPGPCQKWVFLRGLFGFFSQLFQFYAIYLLPFRLAVVLYFT